MRRDSLERLIGLLNLRKKREIELYCRDLVIASEDFANIILAGQVRSLGPYNHVDYHREFVPEDLEPSQEEINAYGRNGVGPLSTDAERFARKIDQTFKTRALLSTHLFYSSCHRYWHLFYFNQRDFNARDNHWKHGPHIHYSQNSFTRESLEALWTDVRAEKPKFPKTVHVRYDYHHNRRKVPHA